MTRNAHPRSIAHRDPQHSMNQGVNMKLSDAKLIPADRETVWQALLSPEVLKQCVPGCTEMTGTAQDGFAATVTQKVGPVKATFKGAVTLSDTVDLTSLTLTGEGKGGAAGFAKGGANVVLTDQDGGTLLSYEVEAKVGGKLAQLGSRIIDGFAKTMADQFFENFQNAVQGPLEEAEGSEEGEKKKGWLGRLVSN